MLFQRLVLPVFGLLSAMTVTLFWGYCWAWVSPFPILAHFFNPLCPVGSEESHYAPEVDVLVSSRYRPWAPYAAYLLPSRENLIYDDGQDFTLYDLKTQSHQPYSWPAFVDPLPVYITDEWLLEVTDGEWVFLNLETKQEIYPETINREIYLADGIPTDLEPLIQQAAEVYIVRGYLILIPTYLGDTSATPTIIQAYGRNPLIEEGNQINDHLRELGVEAINPITSYTPDRRFYFVPTDNRGAKNPATPAIVDAQSQQAIVEFHGANYEPIGWVAGEKGVILQAAERTFIFWILREVDRPILLLRQAPEHLSPEQRAEFAAQDAQEVESKRYADALMGLLLIATAGFALFTAHIVYSHRRSNPSVIN